MSKDTPNKQKNIDDVLLSIDSLLDTASDIQLGDPVASPAEPTSKTPASSDKQTHAVKADDSAPKNQTDSSQEPVQIKQPVADKTSITVESEHSAAAQKPPTKEPLRNIKADDDPSGSLNITTVGDDLSQVMRELPVLEDIVTAEDLALIGSGKEPPKKILTEAFKRLSLADKFIEILENQLSDYNISKLEYKYLHELFDELIDKENNKN